MHAPLDTAGQASTICRAQRALGYQSDILVFNEPKFKYEHDYCLNLKKYHLIWRDLIRFKAFIALILKFDIFHFHGGLSFLRYNLDIPFLRLCGKKVVMQYWGSDVIQTDLATRYSNWTKMDLARIYPKVNNKAKRRQIARISRWVNKTIVGDFSLLPYSPESTVIRQAIDLENLPYTGSKNHQTVTIVHAPSNRNVKGTKYILAAIKKLKKEKYPIRFILLEKQPHQQAVEIYKQADIVVDAILQGSYGILSLECMALGKPVLCFIHPTSIKYYKNLPIVNTDSISVYSNLVKLIKDPQLRKQLGVSGRKYVQENHNAIKIAKQFIKLYEKIW